jgi:hypothetical protein
MGDCHYPISRKFIGEVNWVELAIDLDHLISPKLRSYFLMAKQYSYLSEAFTGRLLGKEVGDEYNSFPV